MSEARSVSEDDWFDSGGTRCAVRIYRPSAHEFARPVIVMAHGLGSVRALRLYSYAERFAAAGYVAVVFDYRGFGDSEGQPRQLLDIAMQHDDWRAALRYARSLAGVDSARVVAWGTSLAGGHVITIAGQGEPLAAIVAQVPHVCGLAAVMATPLRTAARVTALGIQDMIASWFGRPPVHVDIVGPPGSTAMVNSPDAYPGMLKLFEQSGVPQDAYPGTVAARIALRIGFYWPCRWARRIECPVLVQIAARDVITPRSAAERTASKMKNASVRVYDCNHFDLYVDPLFDTVVSDQIDFLLRHVPPVPSKQP